MLSIIYHFLKNAEKHPKSTIYMAVTLAVIIAIGSSLASSNCFNGNTVNVYADITKQPKNKDNPIVIDKDQKKNINHNDKEKLHRKGNIEVIVTEKTSSPPVEQNGKKDDEFGSDQLEVGTKIELGSNFKYDIRTIERHVLKLDSMQRLLDALPQSQPWANANRIETIREMITLIESGMQVAEYLKRHRNVGTNSTLDHLNKHIMNLPNLRSTLETMTQN